MRARSFYLAAGAACLALALYAAMLAPASAPPALAQTPPTPVRSLPNGPRPGLGPATTINVNIALPSNAPVGNQPGASQPGASQPAAGQPGGGTAATVAGGVAQPAPEIVFPGQEPPFTAPPIHTVVDPCADWASRLPLALAALSTASCPAGMPAFSGRYPSRRF
jgi:hypothetical protein